MNARLNQILTILLTVAALVRPASGQIIVAEPTSSTHALVAARSLLDGLQRCTSPCEVRLGERRLVLETPALGQGERGVVFRILQPNEGLVLKISKPDPRSLEILLEEAASHRFWSERQSEFLRAGRLITTQRQGLYSIMTEVRGEPLTNALFRLGLLGLDPVTGEVRARPSADHLPASELAKIWQPLRHMIRHVTLHPQMRTSLSPNNFFISWSQHGRRIETLHLVDFGTDPNGDHRYFQLENLRQYLDLAAEKIQGYLKKPGYLSADLYPLQEEARARFRLPDMFPLSQHESLLREIAQKVVSQDQAQRLPLREILDLPLGRESLPRIAINGAPLIPPARVGDLGALAAAMNQALAGSGDPVRLRIDNEDLLVRRPALGQGDRGIVFAIENSNEVIKIPKANLISVLTLMNESVGYEFWRAQSLLPGSGFSVPERRLLHPLGLYSLMQRDRGEPLTKTMLRFGMLSYNPNTGLASVHPDRIAALPSLDRRILEGAIQSMLNIMRQRPEMSLSISPNNLHVNYADAAKTRISSVTLIDVGLSSKPSDKFAGIRSLADYVEFSRDRLEKYLRVGYADAEIEALNESASRGQCRRVLLLGTLTGS